MQNRPDFPAGTGLSLPGSIPARITYAMLNDRRAFPVPRRCAVPYGALLSLQGVRVRAPGAHLVFVFRRCALQPKPIYRITRPPRSATPMPKHAHVRGADDYQ